MFQATLTALLILLLSALPALADPITAAITAIGAVLKAGGIGAFLLKAAFTVALRAAVSLYEQAKQRRANRNKVNGVTLQVQMGDTVARSYLIGTRATAGHRYYIGYWGSEGSTPNAYITDCVVLSCLPSRNGPQGLDGISVGKRACTILWDEPHPDGRGYPLSELRVNGTDYGWVKYLDGTQTEADAFLMAKFGSLSDRPYLSTMIGRGCQIAILTIRHNESLYSNQLQQGLFQPTPMRIYDLRKDTTAGGDGAHRWDDPSTWEPSENLVTMAYTVARGLYYRGRWVHGGRNFAAYRLPASSWMASANEADRIVDGRRQFRGGLEIAVDTEPAAAIEDMRVGCSGRVAEVGGQLKFLCGAPGSPVYSFTDDDIVVTEDQGFEPFASIKSTYNTATGTYPNPDELWASKDAPEYSDADLLARDGGERQPMAMEFDAVPYSDQVQALMKTALDEAQRWRIHEAFFGPEARALEPNDPIAWTSAANSYANKDFIVVRATPAEGMRTRVVYRELDPADYDPPSIYVPPVTGPTGSLPIPVQTVPDWDVIADYVRDETGTPRQPAIRVKCAPGQDGVTHVDVSVRVQTTDQMIYMSRLPYVSPWEWIIGPMPADTMVEACGTFVSTLNPNQQASVWKAVRTGSVASDLVTDLAHIGADVKSRFQEIEASLETRVMPTIERLATAFTALAAGAQLARESMLAELGSARAEITDESFVRATENEAMAGRIETVRADFAANVAQVQQLITALASDIEASAQLITQLNASVAGNAAAIVGEQTARVNGDTALASSVTAYSTQFNEWFAQGLVKFEAVAAPSGVDARFAILVRGGSGASYKVGGLYIDLRTVSGTQFTEIAMDADRIVFQNSDGSVRTVPMVYEDGVLKLAIAHIGTVTSGVLQSADGKMVINLDQATIVVTA